MISDPSTIHLNERDSLIRVRKRVVEDYCDLPTQIDFELTNRDLAKLNHPKDKFKKLKLSPALLTDLRYYSLLQNAHSPASQLVFTTYYVREDRKTPVIKTTFSLQGKISQEISRQFLQKPQLLQELVTSHFWLIEQVCDRINFSYRNQNSLLAWGLSLIIVLLILPFFFYFLSINWLIKLIIIIGLFFPIKIIIQTLIKKYLSSLILQQLLFGLLSKNTARRRWGLIFLRYFG